MICALLCTIGDAAGSGAWSSIAKAELITVRYGKHGFSDQESAKLWPQVFKWMKKVKLTP